MKDFVSDLIEIGIGTEIDMSNHSVIIQDEGHRKHMGKAYELQDQLTEILTEDQQELLEDFIEALSNAKDRACNLSYLMGVKKAIEILDEG